MLELYRGLHRGLCRGLCRGVVTQTRELKEAQAVQQHRLQAGLVGTNSAHLQVPVLMVSMVSVLVGVS